MQTTTRPTNTPWTYYQIDYSPKPILDGQKAICKPSEQAPDWWLEGDSMKRPPINPIVWAVGCAIVEIVCVVGVIYAAKKAHLWDF